ncbi:PEP-CTERM protein sorting domain [Janthinobacterium lividum]|uniref:PEP-CTERM sorting domain-containing protein n=1 Tax=Janthinobacterium lividum TaxID=29581 RepID=UPI000E082386|nr:PEP-CTERM sorting domain-containing protein [Janthinobacterium lividum]STR26620.1 PEP-CTERM protein sorting domain [Janthinobacterium lividum]
MKLSQLFCCAVFAAMGASASAAVPGHAYTLDFNDRSTACGAQPCDGIPQTYGDVAGVVDLSYTAPWTGSYVPWSTSPISGGFLAPSFVHSSGASGVSIYIEALRPGASVTLHHFDMLTTGGRHSLDLIVSDLQGKLLYSRRAYIGSYDDPTFSTIEGFDPEITVLGGLRLWWSGGGMSVGIDNIAFEVSPVPEPSTYLMLMAGLLAIGAAARRRKA